MISVGTEQTISLIHMGQWALTFEALRDPGAGCLFSEVCVWPDSSPVLPYFTGLQPQTPPAALVE